MMVPPTGGRSAVGWSSCGSEPVVHQHRVGRLILAPTAHTCLKMSLSKTLDPKFAPVSRPAPCIPALLPSVCECVNERHCEALCPAEVENRYIRLVDETN